MEVNDNKYVAGGGTTAMSIIGTALGALGVAGNGAGGSLLGGGRTAELEAKIAKLEAEKYTDEKVVPLDEQAVKNSAEIEALKKEFALRAEIDRKQAKIDILEATAPLAAGIAANTTAIGAIKDVLGKITTVGVPNSAIIGGSTTTTGA